MATYAAYRHVELDKVGCGKRSIMKPPGGDSHDIFGADFHGTPSHHRVLKPPGGGTSSLFASSSEDIQKPRMPQTDLPSPQNSTSSFNGIESALEKTGNDMGSVGSLSVDTNDIDLDAISVPSSVISAEIKTLTAQIQKRQQNGNPLTGEGCQSSEHFVIRVHRQRDGNPVTGEGYDTQDNKPAPPARTRIPPGGYSSGLW